MKRSVLFLVLVIVMASSGLARAADMPPPKAGDSSPLDRLKALEGEWAGKAGAAGGETIDAKAVYHVIADGSAVTETLFPGTPHEMLTVYTLDRGTLVLTHYCAMHNQPRMRARKGGPANELTFDFAGGANIVPGRDAFMHDAKYVFVDADHIRGEWRGWKDGKPTGTTIFEMERSR